MSSRCSWKEFEASYVIKGTQGISESLPPMPMNHTVIMQRHHDEEHFFILFLGTLFGATVLIIGVVLLAMFLTERMNANSAQNDDFRLSLPDSPETRQFVPERPVY